MGSNNIICNCNIESQFNEIISIIELSLSACTLIIAIIGGIFVFNYRAHQKEAIYGFYQNLKTFLNAFQLYINSSSGLPPDWMQILGKKEENITDAEQKLIEPISGFCLSFFNFLSTSSNQIPPSRKKHIKQKWEASFDYIRICIVEIMNYKLQAYPNWEQTKLEETNQKLNESVNNIIDLINKYGK